MSARATLHVRRQPATVGGKRLEISHNRYVLLISQYMLHDGAHEDENIWDDISEFVEKRVSGGAKYISQFGPGWNNYKPHLSEAEVKQMKDSVRAAIRMKDGSLVEGLRYCKGLPDSMENSSRRSVPAETGMSGLGLMIEFPADGTLQFPPNGAGGFVMKRIRVFVATVLLVGLTAVAQAPPEGGWQPLFDGKDLTGWKKNGDEKWIAEQGTILCESTANKYGYLTTEKTYRDFDLRLKFKGEAAGNCGLFIARGLPASTPSMARTSKACRWRWTPASANTPVGFTKAAAAAGL